MSFDFVARLRQELRVTLAAAEETVLGLAERVNRKVQLLRLHWQASHLYDHIASVHRDVGRSIATDLRDRRDGRLSPDTEGLIQRSAQQIQDLKHHLAQLEARIQAMQSEAVREDLQQFLRDLEFRGNSLQYIHVGRYAPIVEAPLRELTTIPNLQVVGVIRGPLVLPPDSAQRVRVGDALLLLGPPEALARCKDTWLEAPVQTRHFAGDLVRRASHP